MGRAPGTAGRGRRLRRCGDEAVEHRRDIGADLQAGAGSGQRIAIRVDVDDQVRLLDHAIVEGGGKVEPGAERQHEIRLGQQVLLIGRECQAECPQIGRVRARHHALLAEGAEHAHAIGLGEGGERLVGTLEAHHLARDHDGALGAREMPGDVLDCLRRGRPGAARAGHRRRRVAGLAFGHVLGQRNGDRPGPAVYGNGMGLGGGRRDLLRRVRLEHRLGQRPQHAVIVDLLKGLAPRAAPTAPGR